MIENAYHQLIGEDPEEGGHYITVWAPRQTGKSWAMLEVIKKIRRYDEFDVGYITMQSAKEERTDDGVLQLFVSELRYWFGIDFPDITSWRRLPGLFTREYFSKPLILIVDEFDVIRNGFINKFANELGTNYLYMNGVIDAEKTKRGHYVKFASPFVQKKIFNSLSDQLFDDTGELYEPFEDLSDTITEEVIHIKNLLKRYQTWLKKNSSWLLEDAPRRKDMRIFEAVYHFNLYRYLCDFIESRRGRVWPEFPTGNGKIDLIVAYKGRTYGVEVKSFSDEFAYREALEKAAEYGKQLGLSEITLVFFVERVDDASREKYEKEHLDKEYDVTVAPFFVETGS